MIRLAVLCMSAIAIATVAALPEPGAASGGGPAVTAGEPVQFRDRSTGLPTTWAWDFDYDFLLPTLDSTRQNPRWTYSQPGIWAVRLQVCNALGCSVRIRFIEVLPGQEPAPEAIFADGFESGDFSRWTLPAP